MNEKEDYLSANEKIVLITNPSAIILSFRLFGVVIAIVALWFLFSFSMQNGSGFGPVYIINIVIVAVGIFIAAVIFWSWRKTEYIVTNKRVRYNSGVLGMQNKDMTLQDVENVQYQQSILGVIFNYGDINIRSAAEDKPITFQGIAKPKKYADQIRFLADV